jgi:tRNA dimethylallyltransferase
MRPAILRGRGALGARHCRLRSIRSLLELVPAHPPLVIALVGPTASGKTDLGIALAEALDLAVLSVDSRQIYRGMTIGTASPTPAQRTRVRHELLDLREPDQPMNVQEFAGLARALIQREQERCGIALLVGGSGLYLQALTGGLRPPAVAPQPWLRQQLTQMGQLACHGLLAAADPASGRRIAPADAVRTQRALEILYATGLPPSALRHRTPPPWRLLELGLDPPDLADRIRRRTRAMYAAGLITETAALMARFGSQCPLLDTIGYGEARRLLAGELDLESAIALTDRRTRQYAKRQRTWFRRQHHPIWLHAAGEGNAPGNGPDLLSGALLAINRVLG